MGAFQQIAKWALIGGGSVLSLIPTVGPIVGAGLISAGLAVKVADNTTSIDPVSNNAAILAQTMQTAQAMNTVAAGGSAISINPLITFLNKYWLYIIGVIAGLIILPKLFKK